MSDEANKAQDRATAARELNVKALGSIADTGRIRSHDIAQLQRVEDQGHGYLMATLRSGKVLLIEDTVVDLMAQRLALGPRRAS